MPNTESPLETAIPPEDPTEAPQEAPEVVGPPTQPYDPDPGHEQNYFNEDAVIAHVRKYSDHDVEKIWRFHNYQSKWLPTIAYPPGAWAAMHKEALALVRNETIIRQYVGFLRDSRKVWSLTNAAKFIVRSILASALFEMITHQAEQYQAYIASQNERLQSLTKELDQLKTAKAATAPAAKATNDNRSSKQQPAK